jgi:hypothetical protein
MFKVRYVRSSALDVTETKTLEQAQQALKSFRVVGQISVSLNPYHSLRHLCLPFGHFCQSHRKLKLQLS